VERLLESYDKNTDFAEMAFIIDPDDQETYEGIDWKDTIHGVLDPRGSLGEKLNHSADSLVEGYDALMFVADDHVFRTPGWDTILMKALKEMGGSGFVYPDDRRRNDIPETVLISSDVIKALGYFAPPTLKHYYQDNAWAELGKRSGLIKFVPEVVIEHLHYSVCAETQKDETYSYAEATWGASDLQAFQEWRESRMPIEVSMLRRKFSPDVKWVLSKF
jgi:hypothetical protein